MTIHDHVTELYNSSCPRPTEAICLKWIVISNHVNGVVQLLCIDITTCFVSEHVKKSHVNAVTRSFLICNTRAFLINSANAFLTFSTTSTFSLPHTPSTYPLPQLNHFHQLAPAPCPLQHNAHTHSTPLHEPATMATKRELAKYSSVALPPTYDSPPLVHP